MEGVLRRLREVDGNCNRGARAQHPPAHRKNRPLGLPDDAGRRAAEQLVPDYLAMCGARYDEIGADGLDMLNHALSRVADDYVARRLPRKGSSLNKALDLELGIAHALLDAPWSEGARL